MTAPVPAAAPHAVSHLLYLHGFRSSPLSTKAQRIAAWIARERSDLHWWCPQLPASPRQAMDAVLAELAHWPQAATAVVGSSLGGFYASVVAEATGCRAVLLNPAVDPGRDLVRYIGEQTFYHRPEDHFYFRPEYVDELRAMTPRTITRPGRYLAVIAKGDELLDWREMSARYRGCRIKLLEGSDHALGDFDDHLPDLIEFLQLKPS